MMASMVSFEVPCGTRAMKLCWGSIVTFTGILYSIGKSLFIWDARGSILVNVRKRSKRTSNSSRLDTSTKVANRVCTLSMESSPNMVTVPPSLRKWMFSTSCALGAGRGLRNWPQRRSGSKLGGWAIFSRLLFFWWGSDFNGLVQHFLFPLVESDS